MNIITNDRRKVCPVDLVDDFEEMATNSIKMLMRWRKSTSLFWGLFYRLD